MPYSKMFALGRRTIVLVPNRHSSQESLQCLDCSHSTKAQANEKPAIIQPQTASDAAFIRRAFDMRQRAVDLGDQAYGAIIVKNDLIIGQSWSRVVVDGDPTAHAEMAAVRDAAMRNGPANLRGATMYSSSRPCPMCEAACYWAGIDGMVHGRSATNAGRPTLCW